MKKAPKAPDPVKTASAQSQYNKTAAQDTLKMNSIDRQGPFGSSTFQRDANGMPTGINTSLNPALQGGATNVMSNFNTLTGQLPTDAFDSTSAAPDTSYLSNTFYNQGANLLAPQFQQQRSELDERLTNRGLPIGAEARNIAEGNLGQTQNLALSNLASQATLLAPAEQQRLINNARQDYAMPYQTAASGLGLLAGMNGLVPNAQQPQANVGSVDYTGLVNNNYNQQMQQYNNQMSGLGQLAGAGLGLLTAPLTGGLTGGLSNTLLGKGFGALSNMWNQS